MGSFYLSKHNNKKDNSIRLYAVSQVWDAEKGKQKKDKQIYLGCKRADGTFNFNANAETYIYLLKGTEFERAFYHWQEFKKEQQAFSSKKAKGVTVITETPDGQVTKDDAAVLDEGTDLLPSNASKDVVCFHNADEENGYLSNWHLSSFTYDGTMFSSMEQYMMYRKAVCFGDDKIAAKILATDNVAEIKALGRLVSGYDESQWNGVRQIVVYEGLMAKFSQNPELARKLKATGRAFLAECAVKDRIWGIGLSMRDPHRLDRASWQGQNLLGYALMMVREKL